MNEIEKIEVLLENIKFRRQRLGYTQNYIANYLDISQYAYHKLEKGKTQLKVVFLIRIMDLLEISFEELVKKSS